MIKKAKKVLSSFLMTNLVINIFLPTIINQNNILNTITNVKTTKINIKDTDSVSANFFVKSENPISGEISYKINDDDTISIVGSNDFSATNFSFLPTVDLGDGVQHKLYSIGFENDDIGVFENNNNIKGNITFPVNLVIIGAHSFESCTNISSINLANSWDLSKICDYAFNGCTGIYGTISFSYNLKSFGAYAFQNNDSLNHIIFQKYANLDEIKVDPTTFNNTNPNKISVYNTDYWPNNISKYKEILKDTSLNLDAITNDLKDGTAPAETFIENAAKGTIDYYISGSEVTICGSTDVVANNIKFKKNITLDDNTYTLVQIGSTNDPYHDVGIFENNQNLTGDIIFPDTIQMIYYAAFRGCTGLNGLVELPSELISISNNLFSGCNNIQSVDFSKCTNIQKIEDYPFTGCTNLRNISNLPDTICYIGTESFKDCINLDSTIDLPLSLIQINDRAFTNTKINIRNVDSSNEYITKIGDEKNYIVINGKQWDNNTVVIDNLAHGDINIPNNITSIPPYFLNQAINTSNINIPDSVQSIGHRSFYKLNQSNPINLPNSIVSIGTQAFFGNKNITSYNFNNMELSKLKTIDSLSFADNSNWQGELVLPNSVETIGDECFKNNIKLEGTFTLPENLKQIGYGIISNTSIKNCAIGNNKNFKKIKLGNGYAIVNNSESNWTSNSSAIGGLAFGDIEINNVDSVAYHSFYESLIDSVYIKNCKSILTESFEGCSNLKTLRISNKVTHISTDSFKDCNNLTDIYLDWNKNELNNIDISERWLTSCSNLKTIHIPYGTKASYEPLINKWISGSQLQEINIVEEPETKDNAVMYVGIIIGIIVALFLIYLIAIYLKKIIVKKTN